MAWWKWIWSWLILQGNWTQGNKTWENQGKWRNLRNTLKSTHFNCVTINTWQKWSEKFKLWGGVQNQRLDGNFFLCKIKSHEQILFSLDYYQARSNMTQIQHGLNVWEDAKGKSRSKETPLSCFGWDQDKDLQLIFLEMQPRIQNPVSLNEIGLCVRYFEL